MTPKTERAVAEPNPSLEARPRPAAGDPVTAAGPRIAATRTIGSPPEAVFGLLDDLGGHWRLAGPSIEVLYVSGNAGAVVRLRGPLGLRRTVRTRLTRSAPPWLLEGRASAAPQTIVTVRWHLRPAPPAATLVTIEIVVQRAAPVDRLLLALGGRHWLASCLRRVLARLEATIAS